MMAKYLRKGSAWRVMHDADADYREALPVGNYAVKKDEFGRYYLEEAPPFEIGRVYGDAARNANRILATYLDRDRNTGVLAVGEKGTGKTLLARLVSHRAAAEHDIPTILVNDEFHGDEFNTFIAGIEGRAVILFDEFEKVYDEEQEALLTLLDGVYQANKLFLLTANSEGKVDRCLLSRPGRIFYYLEYGALDRAFIEEYCEEHLSDASQLPMVVAAAEIYGNFSFDILASLVEEMNRYGESPHAVLKFLNVRMERWAYSRPYRLGVSRDGIDFDDSRISDHTWDIHPHSTNSDIRLMLAEAERDGQEDEFVELNIAPDKIVEMKDGGRIIRYRDKGYDIVATLVYGMRFDPLESLAVGYGVGSEA